MPGKIEWNAPENMTTLKVKMKTGNEVHVTVTGYDDELEMLAALKTVGSDRYIADLAREIDKLYDEASDDD